MRVGTDAVSVVAGGGIGGKVILSSCIDVILDILFKGSIPLSRSQEPHQFHQ